jgi:phage tail sheath protein FI
VYGVLLRFWREGAFKGGRPDEAFKVVCDDSNNPPEEQDNGRLWCEVHVAPAVPMEFITLRIALGEEGRLEVFA